MWRETHRRRRLAGRRVGAGRDFVIPAVLALLAGQGTAGADPGLERELRAALRPLPHPQTVLGVSIVDATSGAAVLLTDADKPLVPASNMKVFVMAAALSELGPDFAFETVLATDNTDLYLIGDGDPGLGDEKIHRARGESTTAPFERWAEALRARGVSQISGDLIVDATIFDDQELHPDWEKGDLGTWYAAPVSGLSINDNCLDITLTPAGKRNGAPVVSVEPPNSLTRFVNLAQSGGKGQPTLNRGRNPHEFRVEGRCPRPWTFGPVACNDPSLLAGDALRTVLSRHGIRITGNIRKQRIRRADGSLPPTLSVVGTNRTTLPEILRRVGKDSQNLFAECLLKRTGYAWARRNGMNDPRGSWELGRRAVLSHLQQAGIATEGLVVADGSGLSRSDRCTARQLTDVLRWMGQHRGGEMFFESLAASGVDGSLRKRLKDLPASAPAKTGTMPGIRTLSGYVTSEAGRRYAFAVLFNGYKGPSAPYKQIQDRICRILAGGGNAKADRS
ncbi:MAG: D-alanyl-D-alanine carboxypeptidase/D-alanyl-D-alanine-endopeptidase [Planctomycetes bacterium]|nr:D-alanyl-D-alanine carboxypeptidase/D-alanyl-D-alanine-endopeptidase [Planctomycetota bacterium]